MQKDPNYQQEYAPLKDDGAEYEGEGFEGEGSHGP
jgi:hypothetical protein